MPSLLLLGAAKPPPRGSPPRWFWGCWVVTKELPVSESFGISPEQEKAIVGTRLIFTPTWARSGRTVVKSPKFSARVVSARDFFRLGNYVKLSQIGVKAKQVTEVYLDLPDDLSDLNFPGNYSYLREKDKDIVIVVEGDYFVAEKAKPGGPTCKRDGKKPK
jgi:hypothetical protein